MRLSILGIGLLIIFIGFALVFIGSITSVPTTTSTTSTAVGGLVLIGPFPIFFGYGNTNLLFPLVIFGIIFTIIAIIFYVLTFYMFKRSQEGKI
ncbi:TIGR00304 family membrane protein [Acidianus manzaensis]|uniref:DUF131 domain-containing protein n=1 Tax=Acidianus manzaensis TaxID=282676 RepID=A0A1W6JZW5_9CREN|nr:DUF131 domain-containing protein [Acidianus manzaensis]ARM75775.1 hypothetical protein B6F84_06820 [Acidianus manzaensis]